jgi:hypothetical protein
MHGDGSMDCTLPRVTGNLDSTSGIFVSLGIADPRQIGDI